MVNRRSNRRSPAPERVILFMSPFGLPFQAVSARSDSILVVLLSHLLCKAFSVGKHNLLSAQGSLNCSFKRSIARTIKSIKAYAWYENNMTRVVANDAPYGLSTTTTWLAKLHQLNRRVEHRHFTKHIVAMCITRLFPHCVVLP